MTISIRLASAVTGLKTQLSSRRNYLPPLTVHNRNKSFIRKELRQLGITLHPYSDPVVRLPAGSLWTVIDVKRVFQKTPGGCLHPTLCARLSAGEAS